MCTKSTSSASVMGVAGELSAGLKFGRDVAVSVVANLIAAAVIYLAAVGFGEIKGSRYLTVWALVFVTYSPLYGLLGWILHELQWRGKISMRTSWVLLWTASAVGAVGIVALSWWLT